MTQSGPAPDLAGLPPTFTYTQARRFGLSDRRLYQLRRDGHVTSIARGLYRRTDRTGDADVDLLEVAERAANATLCLASALARHGLTDDIPATIDIAIPRNQHRPTTVAPVTWHVFDPVTFDIGRTTVELDEHSSIGVYGPERSIIDAIRLRHREGSDLGYRALRTWLTRRGATPSELISMAHHFPRAEKAVREALEILL